jgi:hypothetical protein
MKLLKASLLPVIAVVTGMAATSVSAAPAVGVLGALKSLPEAATSVEKAYWVTRCHWTRWGKRCHRVWVSPRRHWRRW